MGVGKFVQPKTEKALGRALAQMTPGSRVIAGGTDLVIEIRNKAPEIPVLVSLCKVPALQGIGQVQGEDGEPMLRIGATECHAAIAADPLVRRTAGALAMACDHVGSLQVRNRGTIGGSLGNASVAGDMLPVLVLLHAELEILGPEGVRRLLPAEELLAGVGRTVLAENEIIQAVYLPVRPERDSCFVKLGGRHEVTIAEISLCFSWEQRGEKLCNIEGVLGAVDVRPVVLPEVNTILGNGTVGKEECDRLSDSLSERIRIIRENRKRAPKLRIREGEKEYKERAVKGVVYDAVDRMLHMSGGEKYADK